MIDILLAITGLNLLAAILMSIAVRRDFARVGQITLPNAIWAGIAMHGQFVVTFIVAWLDRGSLFAGDFWTVSAGWTLIAVGGAAIAAGRSAYASFKRVYGMKEDELIDHGIYRWTRNPQYIGYAAMFLGAAIASGSLWALVLAGLFLVFIHGFITLVEEPHLKNVFGEIYATYCQRVSRYWGYPRQAV